MLDHNSISNSDDLDFSIPEGYAVVAKTRKYRKINDYGLVILSMRLPYWVLRDGRNFYLCVKSGKEEAVSVQLKKFRKESKNWPPKLPRAVSAKWYLCDFWPLIAYAMILIIPFIGQNTYPGVLEEYGKLNPENVIQANEYWRLVTALTLHGDMGHLLANLLSGTFFLALVCRLFDRHIGPFLFLLSGIGGNLFSTWLQTAPWHNSLGASTAIFGALGLLVGHAAYHGIRDRSRDSPITSRLMPVFAGLALLAILGTGSENTDTPAHLFGFISGIPLGLAAAAGRNKWAIPNVSEGTSGLVSCATAVILATAWAALLLA